MLRNSFFFFFQNLHARVLSRLVPSLDHYSQSIVLTKAPEYTGTYIGYAVD